ncbi:hypothetical protein V8E36_003544, partial [Tilletia maclaganii]
MPAFYTILDRVNDILEPETGDDFYISAGSTRKDKAPAVCRDTSRQRGRPSRLFWSHWLFLDNIELHPAACPS